MPHIHTEPGQHDLTATAYIIRIDDDEPRALVHMHKKLKKLLPVGGHVELDETPWMAMAHEVTEESGYTFSQLDVLQPRDTIRHITYVDVHPLPFLLDTHDIPGNHFHTDLCYGFITNEQPSHSIAEGETDKLYWLTLAEIQASKNMWSNTKRAFEKLMAEHINTWERVPATAFRYNKEEA